MRDFNIKRDLCGIVASLHTPYTDDNRIDAASLVRLVQHCIDSGCTGVLVAAVAGEVSALYEHERKLLLKTVFEATTDQIQVVVGISASAVAESVRLAADAAEFGAPVVMWQPPADLNERELVNALREIAAVGDHQIMLQDLDWTGPGIDVDIISRAAESVPAFTAVKVETAPAGPKYSKVAAATNGRLHLSGGWAVMQMLDGLARGLDAFIPSGLLSIQVRIFNAWQMGDHKKARELFELILPVMSFSNQHIDVSGRFWKYVRVQQGIFSTAHSRLALPLDEIQMAEAQYMYRRVSELENRVLNGLLD